MSKDRTLEDIKSGKGLPPLKSKEISPLQSDSTSVQENERGIIYETFTLHTDENNKDKSHN